MFYTLVFWLLVLVLLLGWLLVALVVWMVLSHLQLMLGISAALFGVYVVSRRRGSLAGPR